MNPTRYAAANADALSMRSERHAPPEPESSARPGRANMQAPTIAVMVEARMRARLFRISRSMLAIIALVTIWAVMIPGPCSRAMATRRLCMIAPKSAIRRSYARASTMTTTSVVEIIPRTMRLGISTPSRTAPEVASNTSPSTTASRSGFREIRG